MIADFCWRGGSERQASAITTALSPDSTMLIRMIWKSATQNSGVISADMLLGTPSREQPLPVHAGPHASSLRGRADRHLAASFQPADSGTTGRSAAAGRVRKN